MKNESTKLKNIIIEKEAIYPEIYLIIQKNIILITYFFLIYYGRSFEISRFYSKHE